ncbi:hypothetical protein DJ524_06755 [Sulfolobus sp. D5]|nr:hypothetical protein DJ524_06755 [Sulfolobus sp. D5]
MITLKGLTWNHIRGYSGLIASSKYYTENVNNQIKIEWNTISLEEFEGPFFEKYVNNYDLLVIDHPTIGYSVSINAFTPIDLIVNERDLQEIYRNSIKRSLVSYIYDNHIWALLIDVSSIFSAYREDIVKKVPKTWDEVVDLALQSKNFKIALPLSPVHALCSFLTLLSNYGDFPLYHKRYFANKSISIKVLKFMSNLLKYLHQDSLKMNPILVLEKMSETDEIGYVPLIFGYVNYSIRGFRKNVIKFTNIPSTSSGPIGSVLGGAGIAISNYSRYKEEAIKFSVWLMRKDIQKSLYFENGGQPGNLYVWLDDEVNNKANNFFLDTLLTVENSYIRPRHHNFPRFQLEGSIILHEYLRGETSENEVYRELNDLYLSLLGN